MEQVKGFAWRAKRHFAVSDVVMELACTYMIGNGTVERGQYNVFVCLRVCFVWRICDVVWMPLNDYQM